MFNIPIHTGRNGEIGNGVLIFGKRPKMSDLGQIVSAGPNESKRETKQKIVRDSESHCQAYAFFQPAICCPNDAYLANG